MNAPISRQAWEAQRRASTDAVLAAAGQSGVGDLLLDYQKRTVSLLDTTAVEVLFIEKSRRIGLTWGLAAWAVLKAGKKKSAKGSDVMYISYAQEMTREFIDACGMWARAFGEAATAMDEFLFDDGDEEGDKAIKAFRIGFASGFEIIALSSAPRQLRGKQGVVIIDEAAFVDNLAELLKAGIAMNIWGGQVVVCSTHDGADNPFNEIIQDILGGRKPYKHMRIDIDDALRDGLYQRICQVSGEEWSAEKEADWRDNLINFYGDGAGEELFCIANKSGGAWLPGPLIEARQTIDQKVLRLELPGNYLHLSDLQQRALMEPFLEELAEQLDGLPLDLLYAFGFDFARVADLTVGCLMSIEQNLTRRARLVFELRNVPGAEQKEITKLVLDKVKSRLIGAAFDATGMGWTVAEDMGRQFGIRENEEGPGVIDAVKFSETWYRVNMPPLKVAFEDGAIELIKDADHLSDLRAVKAMRGVPRVPEIRTKEKGEGKNKAGKKRHGDFAIALALAHYASRMEWSEFAYRGAGSADRSTKRGSPSANRDNHRRDPYRAPLGAGAAGRAELGAE